MTTTSTQPIPPVQPLGNGKYYLNYSMAESTDPEGNPVYTAETLKLDGEPAYGAIVSALIAERYTRDQMEAVINNYLLDPSDANANAEMEAMQAWRAEAKRIAREALS